MSVYSASVVPAYSYQARVLHWLTVLLVLPLIPAGILLTVLPDGSTKDTLFDIHRSVGVLVMLITIWRLIDRFQRPPRPLGEDVPKIQRLAAGAVHFIIYALLILNPIVGWLGASIYGADLNFFWLVTIPSPFTANITLATKILALHSTMGFALAGALCVHIGAALFHHFIVKDNVFRRMTGRA